MLKRVILALVTVFLIGGAFLLFRQGSKPVTAVRVATPTARSKLSERAAAAITTKLGALPAKTETTPCAEIADLFSHKSVQEFVQYLLDSPPFPERCLPTFPKVPDGMGSFESCMQMKSKSSESELIGKCTQFLVFSRAIFLDIQSKDMRDYDSMELSLLLNKILSRTVKLDRLTSDEVRDWRSMTAAAVHRMPGKLEAIKAHVTTFLGGPLAEATFKEGGELRPSGRPDNAIRR